MARSSQQEIAVLMREARGLLGMRTNNQVWSSIAATQDAIKREVAAASDDALSVTFVSPYKDGAWTVSYLASAGPGCAADISVYPSIRTIIEEPSAVVRMVIDDARRRGLLPAEPESAFRR